jgi:hypothetical protein
MRLFGMGPGTKQTSPPQLAKFNATQARKPENKKVREESTKVMYALVEPVCARTEESPKFWALEEVKIMSHVTRYDLGCDAAWTAMFPEIPACFTQSRGRGCDRGVPLLCWIRSVGTPCPLVLLDPPCIAVSHPALQI